MAKSSSDPRVAYPEIKVSSGTGPRASCGYCFPLCHTVVGTREKIVSSIPRGQMGIGDLHRVRVRDLVRVVAIVVPFAPRCRYPGKNCYIEPRVVNGHRRPVAGAPQAAVSHGRARQSSGSGP